MEVVATIDYGYHDVVVKADDVITSIVHFTDNLSIYDDKVIAFGHKYAIYVDGSRVYADKITIVDN